MRIFFQNGIKSSEAICSVLWAAPHLGWARNSIFVCSTCVSLRPSVCTGYVSSPCLQFESNQVSIKPGASNRSSLLDFRKINKSVWDSTGKSSIEISGSH
jgi:hypothetical protein